MSAIPFTVVNLATGQIESHGLCHPDDWLAQAEGEGRVVLEGDYSSADFEFDLVTHEIVAKVPPEPPAPAAGEVSAETQRRVMLASGEARANLQLFGDPIPQEIIDRCVGIRERGATIAAMTPIPPDFRADSYWEGGGN